MCDTHQATQRTTITAVTNSKQECK